MKYVLFTGATGGLGAYCITALSGTGRWIVFAGGTNDATLEELSKLSNIIPVRLDVTSKDSVDAALETVKSYTNHLDAIVNFAGLTGFTSLVEGSSVETIEKLLRVNVTGMARVNRTFFEFIHQGKGRIINCSSESGWMTPVPFAGPYVLSKYAVEAYNDSLRRELLYLDIPVIKIQPGSFETNMTRQTSQYFDKALSETKYYGKLLSKMKPMMTMELNQKNNPEKLAKTVIKAMEARHPQMQYRIGTGRLLALFELLPEKGVDFIYKQMYKRQKKD